MISLQPYPLGDQYEHIRQLAVSGAILSVLGVLSAR